MEENRKKLQEIIEESSRIVFFGGAGVSTESGIPDFRSVDGLYHQKYDYPPETILSHTFLSGIRKSFSGSTTIRCSAWTRSPTRRTGSLPSWRKRESFRR